MESLQTFMDDIDRAWRFDARSYPPLARLNEQEALGFAVGHSALHVGKSLGKISRYAEATDHGAPGDRTELKEATVKLFMSVLRLASRQGMTAEDLLREGPTLLHDGSQPQT